MKKFIAYIVGISIIAGTGYHLYKQNNKELKVASLPTKPVTTPVPTYEPSYIIHNLDGTIDFKFDRNYLENINGPLPTPEMIIVNHNEDGSITFKKER